MKNKLGFTFVEAMVVVLIIAILAAIAVPSFMLTRDISQLTQAGYTVEEAHQIAKGDSSKIEDAIKAKKKPSSPDPKVEGWLTPNPPAVVAHQDALGSISLPSGASQAVEGGRWYTFTWAGSKWMALSDGGTNVVTLLIFDGQKLTQMPGLSK